MKPTTTQHSVLVLAVVAICGFASLTSGQFIGSDTLTWSGSSSYYLDQQSPLNFTDSFRPDSNEPSPNDKDSNGN